MDDSEFEVLLDMYSQDESVINEAKILESGKIPFRYFMMGEEIANAAERWAVVQSPVLELKRKVRLRQEPFTDALQRRTKKKKKQAECQLIPELLLENEMEKMDGFFLGCVH